MFEKDFDIRNWKNEQINYFKKYLNNFDTSSKEYKVLEEGISDLEKISK